MLGGESIGSEYGTEVGTSADISGGEVGFYVVSSRDNGYGKLEGLLLVYVVGTGFRTDGVSYDVI